MRRVKIGLKAWLLGFRIDEFRPGCAVIKLPRWLQISDAELIRTMTGVSGIYGTDAIIVRFGRFVRIEVKAKGSDPSPSR